MAYQIALGNFKSKHSVPQDIVCEIKKMNLVNAYDFTAYKDVGSPNHLSWPASIPQQVVCQLGFLLWLISQGHNIVKY